MKITSWNPYNWYKFMSSMNKRIKSKNISGNLKGEGLLQGGVFLFSKKEGNVPVYMYQEKTGDELPIEEILDAVSKL